MNSRDESKLNMYNAVVTFLNENTTIVSTLTAFPPVVTALSAKVVEIESKAQLELQVITGITINKADLKKEVCNTGAANAAALFAFATYCQTSLTLPLCDSRGLVVKFMLVDDFIRDH